MLEITASKQFNSNKTESAQIMRIMCRMVNIQAQNIFPYWSQNSKFLSQFLHFDLNILTISVWPVSGKVTVPSD